MDPLALRNSGVVAEYGGGLILMTETMVSEGTTQGSPFRKVPCSATPVQVQEKTSEVTITWTPGCTSRVPVLMGPVGVGPTWLGSEGGEPLVRGGSGVICHAVGLSYRVQGVFKACTRHRT